MTDEWLQLINDHPHAGKRVRLVVGTTPDMVQGMTVCGVFMALCEAEDGTRCYAKRSDLAHVTVTPLKQRNKRRSP